MNKEEVLFNAHPVFQVVENVFTGYFFLELLIRFSAFRKKRYCLRDFWFMFDLFLVMLMVGETWILNAVIYFYLGDSTSKSGSFNPSDASILRMLRLAKMIRVSRMVRLLRSVPELLIIIKGIHHASRSVMVFFTLYLIIIYVYAVIFRQLTE